MAFVDHMQRNRFEFKYLLDERCARGVRDFARPYLVHDRYARPELAYAYPIYSLYLDSPGLTIFNTTMGGHRNRFKLRIRYYNDKPTSPVFYEIKRRVNDVILKERAAAKRSSVERLLSGRQPERSDLLDESDTKSFSALTRFCQLQQIVRADGRAIVAYEREAWNAPDNDHVRLTFDRAVRGAWYKNTLRLADKRWVYPPLPSGEVVLELKFTGRFPLWMRDLVQQFDLYRVCMAKYVGCVMSMGPRGPVMTPNRVDALSCEQASAVAALLPVPSRVLARPGQATRPESAPHPEPAAHPDPAPAPRPAPAGLPVGGPALVPSA